MLCISHKIIVFAIVTMSGSLVVYSMHVTWKAIVKIAAHAGDASCLDWHPTRPYVIATGGSGDRCVKGKITKRTTFRTTNPGNSDTMF